jgi:hypothetical protein
MRARYHLRLLRALRRRDPSTLARWEQRRLLLADAPPGKKLCYFCHRFKQPRAFHRYRKSADGRYTICRACCRMQRQERKARAQHPDLFEPTHIPREHTICEKSKPTKSPA